MAKILIVGLGDIGTRLAAALLAENAGHEAAHAAGHEVWGLRRSAVAVPGVRLIQADVTRPETLGALPRGVDYVYVILTPGESSDEAYRRTYVEGVTQLLTNLDSSCLKRLFFVSSTSVYGQDGGEWVDESSPAEAGGFSGQRLREAENLIRNQKFASTVVRFAGIYGPGRLRLLRWVETGRPVQAQPPAWTNRVHIVDCVRFLAFLLARDVQNLPVEGMYVVADDMPVPQHEVLDWLAAELGLPPVPREGAPGTSQNKRLSNALSKKSGFVYIHPDFRSGYRAVIGASDKTDLI